MKITILHGTPKYNYDISLSSVYIKFIKKHNPDIDFTLYRISKEINEIEKNIEYFNEIMKAVKESDGVFWVAPVYYSTIPAQYKRFIELVFEKNSKKFFKNKYAALLVTSINYMDHIAINYMNAVCDDLGMKYVDSLSCLMVPNPGTIDTYKKNILNFFNNFKDAIKENHHTILQYYPDTKKVKKYLPDNFENAVKEGNKKITILTDANNDDKNLINMIDVYVKSTVNKVTVINLHNYNINCCTGCIECLEDNHCSIKDDFYDLYETHVKTADAIIWAGSIKDRHLSFVWKKYFDRSFYNNHIPVLRGKQIGAIISGNLSNNINLRDSIETIIQMQQANNIGIVTDEPGNSHEITALLQEYASKTDKFLNQNYKKPETFYGVGGMRIFRDYVYLLRFPFVSDFKYYKKTFFKTFPQKIKKVVRQQKLIYFLSRFSKDKKVPYKQYHIKRNITLKKMFEI